MDNVFVERLWRSLKYEEVYLHAYARGCQLFCVSRSRETLYVVEGITDYGTSDQGRAH
jgi:hypothetical protein